MPKLLTESAIHVTEVIRLAGLVDATWFTEEQRDKGRAVHLATAYLDQGVLDWSTVDQSVYRRLAQYELFLRDIQPEILAVEERMVNPEWGYQGTPDRVLKIAGREGILDFKGVTESAWHGVQLAAYARCFPRPMARWNLYLTDDMYFLRERKDRQDWEVFKACLTIANWRRSHE